MTAFDECRLRQALQHEQALRTFARALLRDPAEAEDAMQHALLQEAAGRRRAGTGLWPFLKTALRHRAASLHKLAARRRRHEAAAAKDGAVPAVDQLVAREQLRRRVSDAVIALAEPYRTTVWLRWFEDLSPSAIAAHQGVPVATVRTRLQRAHAQLRGQLDAEYGDRRWAALLLPLPSPLTTLLPTGVLLAPGIPLMWNKLAMAAAAVVLAVLAWSQPWSDVASPTPPVGTADRTAAIAALEREPDAERTARTLDRAAPPAVAATTTAVRLVHADGRPAVGAAVQWWSAAERPAWTERIDQAKVRPQWPSGLGPGAWRAAWQPRDERSRADGTIDLPKDPAPLALAIEVAPALYFATDWSPALTSIELPALAPLDIELRGAPRGGRWRGGCFGAWIETDGDDNHGYLRENVTTATGAGVVRWDRIPFRSESAQQRLMVLAEHRCAIEAEGVGFTIEPLPAFAVSPAIVVLRATGRVPQVQVQVVAADGTPVALPGFGWLYGKEVWRREPFEHGAASFDRIGERVQSTVHCVLDDGRWLTAEVPGDDVPTRDSPDVAVLLPLAAARQPLRLVLNGAFAALPRTVWINAECWFVPAETPEDRRSMQHATMHVDGTALLLNGLPDGWRGGLVVAADGRMASFERRDDGAVIAWLPASPPRTLDLPALSRDTGDLPFWNATLKLEYPAPGCLPYWLPLRHYGRSHLGDHPEPLVPWIESLPLGWRTRLDLEGGTTNHERSFTRQIMLR